MSFSSRTRNFQNNLMLNICDAHLLGKNISKDGFTINISKSFYGEQIINKGEAITLLKNSSVINMVGKEIISLSLSLGIGAKQGIKEIEDVHFLIVYKI